MRLAHAALAAAVATALSAGGAQAQLVTQNSVITSEGAKKMIDACEAYAKANNMRLAIWVVDQAGVPIRFKRMEGATTINIDTALRKAVGARMYGMPTDPESPGLKNFLSTPQGQSFLIQLPFWPSHGGVPVRIDGKVVGALSTGGGGGPREVPCLQAGLDAFEK